MSLGSITILTMLSLPTHELGISFHLFRSFSPMFYIFQSVGFAFLLLNLFLSILFDVFVSGIVFLISVLDCSFQVFGALLTLTLLILKLFRNQGSSYWLVITRSGGLYFKVLLRKLYFSIGFQEACGQAWSY